MCPFWVTWTLSVLPPCPQKISTQTLSDLDIVQLRHCPSHPPPHRKYLTWTLSDSDIVQVTPQPIENFQLRHCLTWILSNSDIVQVFPHPQKIINSDIAQLGHCPTCTLSELPPSCPQKISTQILSDLDIV